MAGATLGVEAASAAPLLASDLARRRGVIDAASSSGMASPALRHSVRSSRKTTFFSAEMIDISASSKRVVTWREASKSECVWCVKKMKEGGGGKGREEKDAPPAESHPRERREQGAGPRYAA